ncbi:MAG TPA: KH domain-containing protein [Deltaproteobacteria bacterium]|nr:KH domain-containing protein [Deltaproteobacteria bacterium]
MTHDLDFEGKNVEQAAEEASNELNIKKEDLKFDVLSYGSTGIFGLVGSKKARIRVNLPKDFDSKNKRSFNREMLEKELDIDFSILDGDDTASSPIEKPETAETIDLCQDVLQRIIDTITTDAQVNVIKESDHILFDVKGGNAGILIGKRGQTLESIQYLIEKIANKKNDERIRIQVDVEGYLKSRRTNLESLASRLADKAVRTGKPMTIGQMNAHDRRIVHLSLKDTQGIRTQSIGNGAYRKLMIIPRKKRQQSKMN